MYTYVTHVLQYYSSLLHMEPYRALKRELHEKAEEVKRLQVSQRCAGLGIIPSVVDILVTSPHPIGRRGLLELLAS